MIQKMKQHGKWKPRQPKKEKPKCTGTPLQCSLRRSGKILCFVFAFMLIVVAAYELFINNGAYIWFGVKVDGVSVGGLSPQAAADKLEREFAKKYNTPITFWVGDKAYTFGAVELGLSADFEAAANNAYAIGREGSLLQRWHSRKTEKKMPLPSYWRRETFYRTLLPLANLYRQDPINAKVKGINNGSPVFSASANGNYLDLEAALVALEGQKQQLMTEHSQPVEIHLQAKELVAYPSLENAQSWRLDRTLSVYETYYQAGNNRGNNIELFAGSLNGAVIYPYEIFSVNQYMGERTELKGYLPAPMIVEGKHEDAIAGGICQVVSTLYNAIYELEQRNGSFVILERHHHSLPVEYVPEGRDATVAYGQKDFVFFYTGPTPILIRAEAAGGLLTIRICGGE